MTPCLRELHFNADDNSLIVSYDYPLLSIDERNRVKAYRKPVILHWSGKDFR
ncbi:hypothetical protein [Prevotella veroralis]|nr:hypothetical protein [Prevotella veroralis]